jgi:hypothetical protein
VPAGIGGRRRQAEQLRVGEDAAGGVNVAREARVGDTISVEVDRFVVQIDVDIPVPGDPEQACPVVGVGVDDRRARLLSVRRLIRADVLEGLLLDGGSRGPRPAPRIDDAWQLCRVGRPQRFCRLVRGALLVRCLRSVAGGRRLPRDSGNEKESASHGD